MDDKKDYLKKRFDIFLKIIRKEISEEMEEHNKEVIAVFNNQMKKVSKSANDGLEVIDKQMSFKIDAIHKEIMFSLTKLLGILERKKIINEDDVKEIYGVNDEMLNNLSHNDLKYFLKKIKGGKI